MRFYVPEWEDHVDAHYDFVYDEHSSPHTDDREKQYIWDIFNYETTPIDGVLISREEVEDRSVRSNRLVEHGVHHETSELNIPDWLPTISDCGAWGYKQLPFPPYDNDEMLEFYEALDVSIGVTIDHLVLGTGHQERLYLDERAFSREFTPSDLPNGITGSLDVMVDEWPKSWPEYVAEYEPSIVGAVKPELFDPDVFNGRSSTVLSRLKDDPRAVYREEDTDFRYEMTLDNAEKMLARYEAGDYSFRLMVAIQGWDANSYAKAAREVLGMGYDYIGIGGVAGSNIDDLREIVTELGTVVKDHERVFDTRVDTHIFGFAKTNGFETVGRSGVSSFDSASMLRAAWTGGENYHLDSERRYDAIRVRYPSNRDDLDTAVEKALRAQEMLHGLRAFDENRSIADALEEWKASAERALENFEDYLRDHRFDDRYDAFRLRDIEKELRADYEYAGEFKASFSDCLRSRVQKLLRKDDPESPISFEEYRDLLATAERAFETHPLIRDEIERRERESNEVGTFKQVWALVSDYARWIGDEDHLDAYEKTLRNEPWRECSCPICSEYSIEVAIFRGNNRNRRRGFHNTRKFYDQFEIELPKILVATKASASIASADTVESYLDSEVPGFWDAVHDLPVVEVGTVSDQGVHEWWETPRPVSPDSEDTATHLEESCARYEDLFVYCPERPFEEILRTAAENGGCKVHEYSDSDALRKAVLDRLGYEDKFLPDRTVQAGLTEFNQ